MRTIIKRTEPTSLTQHRQTSHSDYDNYTDKDALRAALVAEQQGLCCYCMGRIPDKFGKMKIEHWHCQANYPDKQLIYRNLLGACLGGERQPRKHQHCDTRKGNLNLLWNPADPDHHVQTRISYETDGTIRSSDCKFDRQLNDVLNLNFPRLKNNRKGVLDAILKWWRIERKRWQQGRQSVPRHRLEQEIANRSVPCGDLAPYNHVAIWWLEKGLARMPQ